MLDTGKAFGMPIVRVQRTEWRRAAEICALHPRLRLPLLRGGHRLDAGTEGRGDDAGGDTSSPVQPTETTYGVAGSDGRFQVFAHVQSTSRNYGITLKVDVDEDALLVQSWVPVYPGADWHERETWEMYGFVFDGHPALRHLYLPSGFEGHPLRKDYPLLSRVVKPWPGLVDVEAMPGGDDADDGRRARRVLQRRPREHRPNPPLPEFDIDPRAFRTLADAQMGVELDTGDMILNLGPQHPATHGTLRLVVRLDGERVIAADPVIGYMHRGYEKLVEFRTYPQITTLINRIDWLSSFANEVPFIDAAEQLMGDRGAAACAVHPHDPHRAQPHRHLRAVPRRDGPAGRRAHARVLRLPRPRARRSTSSSRSPAVASTPTSTASAA